MTKQHSPLLLVWRQRHGYPRDHQWLYQQILETSYFQQILPATHGWNWASLPARYQPSIRADVDEDKETNATKIKENKSFGVQVMRTVPLSLGPLAIIKKNITGYTSVGGWKQQHIPFWQCLHHSNSCSNPETEVACILPDCQLQCQWLLWAQRVLSHHALAQLTTSHCGELQFPILQVYPFRLFVSAKYAFIKLMLRMYPPAAISLCETL